MLVERRVSATYKDLPGGQLLGPTFDYTHRLLDPDACRGRRCRRAGAARRRRREAMPRVSAILARRRPDRSRRRRCRRTMSPATSPASRWNSRWRATSACRRCRAATRVSCWRSAIPPSAAMPATIPSSAKSASARSSWSSTCRNCRFAVPLGTHPRHRVPDGQPVQGFGQGAAAVHPRLRPGLRPERAQGDGDGAVRPRAARRRIRRGCRRRRAGRGVRHLAFRQCPGDRLRRASEAAALCRLPGRARSRAPDAREPHSGKRRWPADDAEAAE